MRGSLCMAAVLAIAATLFPSVNAGGTCAGVCGRGDEQAGYGAAADTEYYIAYGTGTGYGQGATYTNCYETMYATGYDTVYAQGAYTYYTQSSYQVSTNYQYSYQYSCESCNNTEIHSSHVDGT